MDTMYLFCIFSPTYIGGFPSCLTLPGGRWTSNGSLQMYLTSQFIVRGGPRFQLWSTYRLSLLSDPAIYCGRCPSNGSLQIYLTSQFIVRSGPRFQIWSTYRLSLLSDLTWWEVSQQWVLTDLSDLTINVRGGPRFQLWSTYRLS